MFFPQIIASKLLSILKTFIRLVYLPLVWQSDFIFRLFISRRQAMVTPVVVGVSSLDFQYSGCFLTDISIFGREFVLFYQIWGFIIGYITDKGTTTNILPQIVLKLNYTPLNIRNWNKNFILIPIWLCQKHIMKT